MCIRDRDGTLRIPPQAMEEYHIADEGKVYLFTGSKTVSYTHLGTGRDRAAGRAPLHRQGRDDR